MKKPTDSRKGFVTKGFTLVELLVVVGILAILIGLLLPTMNKARISAEVAAQKSDLQTIMTAIANYKADFGVIPQNTSQSLAPHPAAVVGSKYVPIHLLSLASALIGPSPAMTQMGNTPVNGMNYVIAGDGADGYGSRVSAQSYPTTLDTSAASVPAGSTAVVLYTVPPSWTSLNVNGIWPGTNVLVVNQTAANMVNATPVSLTFSPGKQFEESVGAMAFGSQLNNAGLTPPTTFQFKLLAPLHYNHLLNSPNLLQTDGVVVIHTLNSKAWSSYIPPDKFKVAYYPALDPTGNLLDPNVPVWPEILDKGGNPILYFTRFASNNNRLQDSIQNGGQTKVNPPLAVGVAIKAGPLIGVSTPGSVEKAAAAPSLSTDPEPDNAIWDYRDATSSLLPEPAIADANAASGAADPWIAIRWMLGDDPISQADYKTPGNDNFITGSEKVFDGDFFLVSIGPKNDTFGMPAGLCNLVNVAGKDWQATFDASANVYSFDKP